MNTKIVDGHKFIKDSKTGYWQCNEFIVAEGKPKRLHRYIWEKYNGKIPKGYQIHHIDRDKDNNDISNLKLLSEHEHLALHGKKRFEDSEWAREFEEKGIEASKSWHSSKEGHEWHKKHWEQDKDKLYKTFKFSCLNCGKEFEGHYGSKFCSNKCKSAYRRKRHLDDVERICVVCGKSFKANKYSKTKTCSRSCAAKLSNKGRKSKIN